MPEYRLRGRHIGISDSSRRARRSRHKRRRQNFRRVRTDDPLYGPGNMALERERRRDRASYGRRIGFSLAILQLATVAIDIISFGLSVHAYNYDYNWNKFLLTNKMSLMEYFGPKATNLSTADLHHHLRKFLKFEVPLHITPHFNTSANHSRPFIDYTRYSRPEQMHIIILAIVAILATIVGVLELRCYKKRSLLKAILIGLFNFTCGVFVAKGCAMLINSTILFNNKTVALIGDDRKCNITQSVFCFCIPAIREKSRIFSRESEKWIEDHYVCQLETFKLFSAIFSWCNAHIYFLLSFFPFWFHCSTASFNNQRIQCLQMPTDVELNRVVLLKTLTREARKIQLQSEQEEASLNTAATSAGSSSPTQEEAGPSNHVPVHGPNYQPPHHHKASPRPVEEDVEAPSISKRVVSLSKPVASSQAHTRSSIEDIRK